MCQKSSLFLRLYAIFLLNGQENLDEIYFGSNHENQKNDSSLANFAGVQAAGNELTTLKVTCRCFVPLSGT